LWPQLDRRPELGFGFVEPAALAQDCAESISVKWIVGPKSDGLPTGDDARVEDLIGFAGEAMRP
jgi:hypothetical protein